MADLITVVLPVYNVTEYLERAVDSILNQSYSSLEILLIDDGSTDGSGALCDALACRDGRIRVIHKENTGVSDTRNVGIASAKGQYLVFVDSDDYVETTYVERLYTALCEAQAQVAVCFMKKVYEDGRWETLAVCDGTKDIAILSGEQALQHVSDTAYPIVGFCWGTLYDASMLREHNLLFDTTITLCEDMLFKCHLYLQDVRIAVVHEALYIYCIRGDSATGSALRNTDRLVSEIKARKEMLGIVERLPNSTCAQRVRLRLFDAYLNVLKSVAITGNHRDSVPVWVQEMKETYRNIDPASVTRKNRWLYRMFCVHAPTALWILRRILKK